MMPDPPLLELGGEGKAEELMQKEPKPKSVLPSTTVFNASCRACAQKIEFDPTRLDLFGAKLGLLLFLRLIAFLGCCLLLALF